MGLWPGGRVRGFEVVALAALPVLEGGRVKPLDSVARNSLLVLRGTQDLPDGERPLGADEWLLDVLFRPAVADQQRVFVVDDPEVLGLMGLERRAERRLSVKELLPHVTEIARQAGAARAVDEKLRTRFQRAVVQLHDRIWLYRRLRNSMQPARSAGLDAEIAAARGAGRVERQAELAELAVFRALPPAPGRPPDAFENASEALAAVAAGGEVDPALGAWAGVSRAWAAQDVAAFDRSVASLRRIAADRAPAAARGAALELAFNRAQPFRAGIALYVAALLALFASWLFRPAWLERSAFALVGAGALVHTAGLAARIAIQGRPPVTNLYSSAVFVGWAAVVIGLLLERIYRRGLGTAVAAVAGFATLIVAHHLGGSGDTLEMMRAVLDSNFWLATHVVAITIGYSGTFLAGLLGVVYAVRRHLPGRAGGLEAVGSAIYGVLCFSLLFSFLGTVLGGIWADQSWGRFWGWDPKENGALLIVLWNAIILHARIAGWARARGIAAMAIFGNVVTSLSWFGVNMLGIGLHSYGFMDGAFKALLAFIGVQLSLVVLALVPARAEARPVAAAGRAAARLTGSVLAACLAAGLAACVPAEGPLMRPGQDCLACHGDRGGATRWSVAGTLYDPTSGSAVKGSRVRITDASGWSFSLRTNDAGNFYTAERVAFPLRVCVERAGGTSCMEEAVTEGSCNVCHGPSGALDRVNHARFFPVAAGTPHEPVACAECHGRYSGAVPQDFRCAACHASLAADLAERHAVTSDPAIAVTEFRPASDACLRCHGDAQVNRTADHPAGDGTPPHQDATCLTCHDVFRADKPFAADFATPPQSWPAGSGHGCARCHAPGGPEPGDD